MDRAEGTALRRRLCRDGPADRREPKGGDVGSRGRLGRRLGRRQGCAVETLAVLAQAGSVPTWALRNWRKTKWRSHEFGVGSTQNTKALGSLDLSVGAAGPSSGSVWIMTFPSVWTKGLLQEGPKGNRGLDD